MRRAFGDRLGDEAAHRVPDDDCAGELESIHQLENIIRELSDLVPSRRFIRRAVATKVRRDDSERSRHHRHDTTEGKR